MSPNSRMPDREDGWVLVSAIVLMAIMLSVGLASFAFVDTGQKRSRESRERESSLSLAEAALYAQGFALTRNWPNPAKALTGDCSSAAALTATTLYCPDRDTLAKGSSGNGSVAQLANVDLNANATWSTKVRDNFGDLNASYDPTKADNTLTGVIDGVTKTCPGPCRMDFNGDRQLWVSAKAIVRGRPRTIVARLKLEQLRESVPQAGVVAGALDVTNNGNKLMVDGTGSSIIVRCSPLTSTSCMSYDAGKGQLTPAPASTPEPAELHDPGPAAALQGAREGRRHLLRRLPGQRRRADRRGRVGGVVLDRATRTTSARSRRPAWCRRRCRPTASTRRPSRAC